MHKTIKFLIDWAKSQLWITDGESLKPKDYTIVYYHSYGLRIRYCKKAVYPIDYDKNSNSKPGYKSTKNFNEWAKDVKESLLPTPIVAENRLKELQEILNKVTAK